MTWNRFQNQSTSVLSVSLLDENFSTLSSLLIGGGAATAVSALTITATTATLTTITNTAADSNVIFRDSTGLETGRLARAYCYATVAGGVVRGFNVTSITDTTVNVRRYSWAYAFPDTTYVLVGQAGDLSGGAQRYGSVTAKTASTATLSYSDDATVNPVYETSVVVFY